VDGDESEAANCDFLGYSKDSKIKDLLSPGEIIILSAKIVKQTSKGDTRKRSCLITSHAFYDIQRVKVLMYRSYAVKRKIRLKLIDSITISTSSTQFILHVENEHDIRMNSDHCLEITQTIQNLLRFYLAMDLPIHEKAHPNLVEFCTTRDELDQRPSHVGAEVSSSAAGSSSDWSSMSEGGSIVETIDGIKTRTKGFSEYDLERVIGRGAFGKVMLVKKRGTSEYYAMKTVRKKYILDQNQAHNIMTERNILATIRHPFVVQMKSSFQTEGKLVFILEYVNGGELFHHLRSQRRFPENRTKFYAAQIGMALDFLHKRGFIYRDLKPENILVDLDGYLKITDFGLATEIEHEKVTKSVVGTCQYLAPEILGRTGYDQSVDWWSFGILIYEMLYGRPPFYVDSRHVDRKQYLKSSYLKILKEDITFPLEPYISMEARDLVASLLCKDPRSRLGKNGFGDISQHAFFSQVNFDAVYNKEITPDYRPEAYGPTDVNNFDPTFTGETAVDSLVKSKILSKDQAHFHNFSFDASADTRQKLEDPNRQFQKFKTNDN